MKTTSKSTVIPESRDVVPANPMDIVSDAVARGASTDVIAKLLDLQERYEGNLARKAFNAAIAEAKPLLGKIIKTERVDFESKRTGGQTNYSYESLASVAAQIDPVLAQFGLAYRFKTENMMVNGRERVLVTCVLFHRDGYSVENSLSGPPDASGAKNELQALGSALTYLQRYTLKAALGIAAGADTDARNTDLDQPINAEQIAKLEELIESSGADRARFLAYAHAETIEEIKTRYYEDCINTLMERKRRKK